MIQQKREATSFSEIGITTEEAAAMLATLKTFDLIYCEKFLYGYYEMLSKEGSIIVRGDHYDKVQLDNIFGKENFRNEIIWTHVPNKYSTKQWTKAHHSLLWYSKSDVYIFNYDEMDYIPYMAPGMQTVERIHRGKTPTSVWWWAYVDEIGVYRRIIKVHSEKNSRVGSDNLVFLQVVKELNDARHN